MDTQTDPNKTNLWLANRGEYPFRREDWSGDFTTLVDQVIKEGEVDLVLRVRRFEDFRQWATEALPDRGRYTYDAMKLLHERKAATDQDLQDYDSFRTWQRLRTDPQRKEPFPEEALMSLARDRYIHQLAASMLTSHEVPPLVWAQGPVDGVHRTLAAMKLGLIFAPVLHITPKGALAHATP